MRSSPQIFGEQLGGRGFFSRRGFLISISGIDGSGKTTQIDLLEKELRKTETRVMKVWSRWRPISSLPLLALLLRRRYAQVHATSSIGFVETRLPKTGGLSFLWCLLTQTDNFMKTAVKLAIPLALGYTIICDRYVLDLLVEGMADLHDSPNSKRLGYKLVRLLPHANIGVLIDIDADSAFKRKPDLPSLSHFVERVRLYRELARIERVTPLDGTQSPENIHQKIWSLVIAALNSRGGRGH